MFKCLLCSERYLFLSLFYVRHSYFLSLYKCLASVSFYGLSLPFCVLCLSFLSSRLESLFHTFFQKKLSEWYFISSLLKYLGNEVDSIMCMLIVASELQICCLFQFYRIYFDNILLKMEVGKKNLLSCHWRQAVYFLILNQTSQTELDFIAIKLFEESPFWWLCTLGKVDLGTIVLLSIWNLRFDMIMTINILFQNVTHSWGNQFIWLYLSSKSLHGI